MRLLKIIALLAPALAIPLLASCADAFPAERAQILTPQQASLVHATCINVMHLKTWQQEFSGCIDSLSQTLAYRIRSQLTWKSEADCSGAGLKRGTPEFSDCVLNRQDVYTAQLKYLVAHAPAFTTPMKLAYDSDGSAGAGQSFFDGGFKGERRKEEYACAQLSLEPNSGPFGQCVADLDTTIFNIEHPPG